LRSGRALLSRKRHQRSAQRDHRGRGSVARHWISTEGAGGRIGPVDISDPAGAGRHGRGRGRVLPAKAPAAGARHRRRSVL